MKLPALLVDGFDDCQLNFEALQNAVVVPSGTKTAPRVTWGLFQTGTGTIASSGTADWTLSGLAAGVAVLNYPTRTSQPAVLLTVDTAGSGIYTVAATAAVGVSSATISTWNISATLPPPQVNAFVSFVVIG